MSTATIERSQVETSRKPLGPRPRVVLYGISWETYERLYDEIGDQHVRMFYDRGRLELVSPLNLHERYKGYLSRFVDHVLLVLRMPYEAAGSTRWKRVAVRRGIEPDECFYISPEKLAIIGGRAVDRPDDPMPDVAIEVDCSEQAADRALIYAALAIPELWTYEGDRLQIGRLGTDGAYESIPRSQFLPVSVEEVEAWVAKSDGMIMSDWINELREWTNDVLVPRHEGRV